MSNQPRANKFPAMHNFRKNRHKKLDISRITMQKIGSDLMHFSICYDFYKLMKKMWNKNGIAWQKWKINSKKRLKQESKWGPWIKQAWARVLHARTLANQRWRSSSSSWRWWWTRWSSSKNFRNFQNCSEFYKLYIVGKLFQCRIQISYYLSLNLHGFSESKQRSF